MRNQRWIDRLEAVQTVAIVAVNLLAAIWIIASRKAARTKGMKC